MQLGAFLLILYINYNELVGTRIKEHENWERSLNGGEERVRNFKSYAVSNFQLPVRLYEEMDARTPWTASKFDLLQNNDDGVRNLQRMITRGYWNFAPTSHRAKSLPRRLKRFLKQSIVKGRFVSLKGDVQTKANLGSSYLKPENKKSLRNESTYPRQDAVQGQLPAAGPPPGSMEEGVTNNPFDTSSTAIQRKGSVEDSTMRVMPNTFSYPEAEQYTQLINYINRGSDDEVNDFLIEPNFRSQTPSDPTPDRKITGTNEEIPSYDPEVTKRLWTSTTPTKPILPPQATSPEATANDLRQNEKNDGMDDTDNAKLTIGVDLAINLCGLQDEFDETGNLGNRFMSESGSKYLAKYQLTNLHGCHAFKWTPCKKRGIIGNPCGWYELLPC